jgi:isopentenyl-diphosphate delta-isomerase
MKLIIVNANDEIIGAKERNDRDVSDIIRVAGAWVLNEKNEALVAQRALNKFHDPGKWAVSAAGTVEDGETYAQNICKEIEEELGISVTEDQLIKGPYRFVQTQHRYFVQMYFAKFETTPKVTLQREEVESMWWVPVPDLSEWFAQKPTDFIESFSPYLKDLQDFVGRE